MNLDDYIKKDREFLHGIATPLMVASGQIEVLKMKNLDVDKEELETKIQKIESALFKIGDLLSDRRNFVKSVIAEIENAQE